MSKQDILRRIKDSLHANPIHSQSTHYTNPLKKTQEDKLQEYIALQTANKAIVIQSSPNELIHDIYNIFHEANSHKILYNLDIENLLDIQTLHDLNTQGTFSFIPYKESVDESRDKLFNIDTSLIRASCGVANLGIIGVATSKQAPRLSSLITRTCIMLLKKTEIVEHFFEGICVLKNQSQNGKLPTNMVFIAGPSRTADIELQTVFGVHGSLKTYIILY